MRKQRRHLYELQGKLVLVKLFGIPNKILFFTHLYASNILVWPELHFFSTIKFVPRVYVVPYRVRIPRLFLNLSGPNRLISRLSPPYSTQNSLNSQIVKVGGWPAGVDAWRGIYWCQRNRQQIRITCRFENFLDSGTMLGFPCPEFIFVQSSNWLA